MGFEKYLAFGRYSFALAKGTAPLTLRRPPLSSPHKVSVSLHDCCARDLEYCPKVGSYRRLAQMSQSLIAMVAACQSRVMCHPQIHGISLCTSGQAGSDQVWNQLAPDANRFHYLSKLVPTSCGNNVCQNPFGHWHWSNGKLVLGEYGMKLCLSQQQWLCRRWVCTWRVCAGPGYQIICKTGGSRAQPFPCCWYDSAVLSDLDTRLKICNSAGLCC